MDQNRRHRAVAISALAGLLLATCSTGGGRSALSPQDTALMNQAAQEALETNKAGQALNWSNAATGHGGSVLPLETYADKNRPCRDYQQTLTVAGRTDLAYDIACRGPDGTWESAHFRKPVGIATYRPGYPWRLHGHPRWDPYYRHGSRFPCRPYRRSDRHRYPYGPDWPCWY